MDEGMEVGRERWRAGRGSGIWRGMRRGGGMEGQKGEWEMEGNRERMGRGRGVCVEKKGRRLRGKGRAVRRRVEKRWGRVE